MYVFVLIVMVMKWLTRLAGISGRIDRPAGLAFYAKYALAVFEATLGKTPALGSKARRSYLYQRP
jgi:hypothetical protein